MGSDLTTTKPRAVALKNQLINQIFRPSIFNSLARVTGIPDSHCDDHDEQLRGIFLFLIVRMHNFSLNFSALELFLGDCQSWFLCGRLKAMESKASLCSLLYDKTDSVSFQILVCNKLLRPKWYSPLMLKTLGLT